MLGVPEGLDAWDRYVALEPPHEAGDVRGSNVDNSVALVSLRQIDDKVINRLTTNVAELLVIGSTVGSPVREKLAYFMGDPRGEESDGQTFNGFSLSSENEKLPTYTTVSRVLS